MHKYFARGFTIVELTVIIVIIGILAGVTISGYNGWQHRTAQNTVKSDLIAVSSAMKTASSFNNSYPSDIATLSKTFTASPTVALSLSLAGGGGPVYHNLTDVQNGVLFQAICEELIANPSYSTIHSANGSQTDSVVMRCDDNISHNSLLITGWDSKTWNTPLTKSSLESYIASVPYDSWWIDRQDVIRAFHQQLIDTFESRGGTWPVKSFWDPWANQWSGVHKEGLPTPDTTGEVTVEQAYCVQAVSSKNPDEPMHINAKSYSPINGPC